MGWYAVRSVYLFGTKKNGRNIFEERTVCFEAADFTEANFKAAAESQKYAESNNFEVHQEQLAYKQDGETLIDEYEIWSELYESDKNLNDFYLERYEKYIYDPSTD
ncbi:hypothetical protein [Pseudomonas sp. Marseille-Q8238]